MERVLSIAVAFVCMIGLSACSGLQTAPSPICSAERKSPPSAKAAPAGKSCLSTELCSFFAPKAASTATEHEADSCASTRDSKSPKNPKVPALAFPIKSGKLSSPFGYRHGVFHCGLDICACKGEPISACAPGTIEATGSRKGYRSYGKTVLLDHGNDVFTHYAHLSKILVTPGQKIKIGDTIGLVGSTGRSTSPHLHLEVRVGRQLHNPLAYFSERELRNVEIAKNFNATPMGPVSSRRRLSYRR
jgi:murein DD-endopeptidase MepM/ murein hydrolase activator NlpD